MKHYQKRQKWAMRMSILASAISKMLCNRERLDRVFLKIEIGLTRINGERIYRYNAYGQEKRDKMYVSIIKNERGEEYYDDYMKKLEQAKTKLPEDYKRTIDTCTDELSYFYPKSNEEYPDALVSRICEAEERIFSAKSRCILIETPHDEEKSNLDLVKQEYFKLKRNQNPTLDEINKSVATIHWLIAQETPYRKGSDSFANILTKVIYHSCGVKVSPYKKGVSADFEAFYCDLDDYIKKYPSLFKEPPVRYEDV